MAWTAPGIGVAVAARTVTTVIEENEIKTRTRAMSNRILEEVNQGE
jgi:hypothetical protein